MAGDASGGLLYGVYRDRIGEPTTGDEVRGYWVFLTGLVLGTLGLVLFVPSTSPGGAAGLTLREASIFVSAVGLAMLVAGPVVRLPLQSWANYAAYAGQALCFLAAVWFLLVFPADWNVQTGNQPVIVLYAVGLAVVTLGGVVGPLLAGARGRTPDANGAETAAVEGELAEVRAERDRLADRLRTLRAEIDADDDATARLAELRRSQARFELYEDAADEWRWRLRHRNGNVVASSGEGYTRKHNARKGMRSVRRNALGATTLVFEREPDLPDPDEEFAPVEEAESQGTFELYEDNAGEARFRLRHDNGNVIADGSEGYDSKSNAKRAVENVRAYVGPADYLWFDPTGFEVYRDRADEWRWRLVHRNGNVLADSGEGYTRRNDATRAAERLRDRVDEFEFEVYEDAGEEYRWRCRSGNGQVIADSGEGYESEGGAEDAVERVREHAPDARILDVGRAAFEIYADQGGVYRWRLRHRNGNVLLDGGQGYASRSGARDGVESVKRNAPNADLED